MEELQLVGEDSECLNDAVAPGLFKLGKGEAALFHGSGETGEGRDRWREHFYAEGVALCESVSEEGQRRGDVGRGERRGESIHLCGTLDELKHRNVE